MIIICLFLAWNGLNFVGVREIDSKWFKIEVRNYCTKTTFGDVTILMNFNSKYIILKYLSNCVTSNVNKKFIRIIVFL